MTFTHLDGLAVGSALAICARSPSALQRVQRALPYVAALGVIGVAAVRLRDGDAFYWSLGMATFGYSFAALAFGALLVWVLMGRRTFGATAFFASPFMRLAGKYSYALYLIHVPVAGIVFPAVRQVLSPWNGVLGYDGIFMAAFAVAFVVSWGVAILSWHLLEKRILALKRFFNYESAAQPAEAPAAARSVANMPHG
jgi:peptidoglycan/LPS O-acetylase OafA/YrhL